jgi:hypothetical protein
VVQVGLYILDSRALVLQRRRYTVVKRVAVNALKFIELPVIELCTFFGFIILLEAKRICLRMFVAISLVPVNHAL